MRTAPGALGKQGRVGTRGDRAAPGTVSPECGRFPVTTTTAAQSKPALQAWPDEPRDAARAADSRGPGGSAPRGVHRASTQRSTRASDVPDSGFGVGKRVASWREV